MSINTVKNTSASRKEKNEDVRKIIKVKTFFITYIISRKTQK